MITNASLSVLCCVCVCVPACVSMRTGPSVPGYDDTAGDNASADAADPPAAGPEPPAAPGPAPAATGSHVTAGKWVASTSTAITALTHQHAAAAAAAAAALQTTREDFRALRSDACFISGAPGVYIYTPHQEPNNKGLSCPLKSKLNSCRVRLYGVHLTHSHSNEGNTKLHRDIHRGFIE